MRASIRKSTGLIIGSCAPANDEALLNDALSAGIPANDVEFRDVTDAEHDVLIKTRDDLSHPYTVKRAAAYPPYQDYIDAQVKMASSDPVMQSAGALQLNDYVNKCLAVKLQFPKV